MISFKKHAQIALGLFLIAATLGLLLRYFAVSKIDFNYRNVVHAHSHVAVMGWIYFALTTLIGYYFLKPNVSKKIYRIIFGVTISAVIGMLLSFPFQGYAFFSILFSSLFLISSYLFCWAFFKYTPNVLKRKTASYITLKYALIYLIVSSIGPWSIGVVMATVGPDPFWYNTTIYFYLHFQYNAWIILGIIGVFLRVLEDHNIKMDSHSFKSFIITFNVSVLLTFFISILFSNPPHEFYALSILGAILQFIPLFILFKFLLLNQTVIKQLFSKIGFSLLHLSFVLFLAKIVMQLIGSFPFTAKLITANHYLALGFLHWIFLGVITLSLLALFEKTQFIRLNSLSVNLYLFGFFSTELIIFYKPMEKIFSAPILSRYNLLLFIASLILVFSIAYLIILQSVRSRKST